jgi:hypothetical protein
MREGKDGVFGKRSTHQFAQRQSMKCNKFTLLSVLRKCQETTVEV